MVKERKNVLDKEYRHELTKEEAKEMMDFLMVKFDDGKDYHYNYYFETCGKNKLADRNITLRLRTIVKENDISYNLTLKIPAIDENTFLEYNERISEKEMRRLVYNNHLPDGEIKDLNSIHGGHVEKTKMIRTNRVYAPYKDIYVFFDQISHRGKNHYEVGVRIDSSPNVTTDVSVEQFKDLLSEFNHTFTQAERRSKKFQ